MLMPDLVPEERPSSDVRLDSFVTIVFQNRVRDHPNMRCPRF